MTTNPETPKGVIITKVCRVCTKVTNWELEPGVDPAIVRALQRFVHFITCENCNNKEVAAVKSRGKQNPSVRLPYRDD